MKIAYPIAMVRSNFKIADPTIAPEQTGFTAILACKMLSHSVTERAELWGVG